MTMPHTDPNSLPPRDQNLNAPRHLSPDTETSMGGVLLAVMFAIALVAGAALYAMTTDPSTTTASNPPPTTTGQGSRRIMEKSVPTTPAPTTDVPK